MNTKLTSKQQAIIATIHQEPDYIFKYDELKAAKRLSKRKVLKKLSTNKFKVTDFGEKVYFENIKKDFGFSGDYYEDSHGQ